MATYAPLFVFFTWLNVACSVGVVPTVKLNDGREIPQVGLGTWLGTARSAGMNPKDDDSVQKAVEWAIDAGYRHIDTASIYDTEGQIGRAIKKKIDEGVVKREDLFITTKLWNDKHARDAVVPALQDSLSKLGLDYVDLYLMHWPMAHLPNYQFDKVDYLETWQGMEDAHSQGLAKSIGVSNFNLEQLQRLVKNSKVKPAMLQVELNLNLQQPELRAYCREQNIAMTGYTPFGSLFPSKAVAGAPPPRVDDPELVKIAKKYNKNVPQIALRYLVELGVVTIPKSTTKDRIEKNIDVFDFKLTDEERNLLQSYDKGYRTISVSFWESHPYYPFKKN